MLHFIKGKLAMHFTGGVVIETGGLGYEVYVPDNSSVYLTKEGDAIMVYTAMIVREDDISIYGFADKESLGLFRKLMTVNGVGAKAALSILSALPAGELQKAIIYEDAAALTKANGIGKKIAQRIVLELKDKLDVAGTVTGSAAEVQTVGSVSEKGEAVNALMALGYSKGEAVEALAGVPENDLKVEEYIKRALKRLS
ncbi:Holliday junction branch migration protein RuvA [Clostridium aminobutyricum]|uniref:Holliday junction branch migration complex subunit RuvA n=1 Tax=Clostridium aminobutyricum TaxID=33953 RepID=A0A939IGW3_CLOAM|nr:Holliday junction branch migration protein RuvA [Clostridium aminobutyricum]MBN7772662.1 Holliday junction branch migration protein RuvA [Clostridium aminobutyricum]